MCQVSDLSSSVFAVWLPVTSASPGATFVLICNSIKFDKYV